jgi:hypothetical protein
MPVEFYNNSKALATEELRLQNYKTQLQNRNEAEVRDIQAKHADEVQHMLLQEGEQIQEVKRAYEVQISQEAEELEDRLHNFRLSAEEKIENEKRTGEDELHKVQADYKHRIDEYRRSSEAQLETLRRNLLTASEDMHEKAKRSARSEREIADSQTANKGRA